MADSDAQIRADLAEQISDLAAAANSVVFPYWVLGILEGEWAGPLQQASPNGKVRAWIVTRQSFTTERFTGGASRKENTYRVLFFVEYGGHQGESEDSFGEELDAVADALKLNVLRIDLIPAGGVLLHYAVCETVQTVC